MAVFHPNQTALYRKPESAPLGALPLLGYARPVPIDHPPIAQSPEAQPALASRRELWGWAMFDFANQAYTLLIITVVFGDLFTRVIVGASGEAGDYRLGNLLWSLALALSYLMVVVAAPVCGAAMDAKRQRKRYLWFSYLATVACTAALYWLEPGWIVVAMVLVILSNFAYAMGEGFIASFLPHLGPRQALGWISGLGWALGYVGGLVATAFALVSLGEVSLDNYDRIRWVGPLAAAFFLIAAIPTFLYVREPLSTETRPLRSTLDRLRSTWRALDAFQDLRQLMVSIFFCMAGIYIVISFAFIYGSQVVGWDESVRVLMFVLVQITAAVGALVFGLAQSRLGAKGTYLSTLLLWMLAIVMLWQTPSVAKLAAHWGWAWQAQHIFLVAGCLAGLGLGSAQSAGRALVGQLTPYDKAAEFFGFWGMSSKLAAVVGLLVLGLLQAWFGLANAMVLCLLWFALAFWTALRVDALRGQHHAERWASHSM